MANDARATDIAVEDLRYGDMIVEDNKKTVVKTMTVCGSRFGARNKIHVNDNACYDRGTIISAVIAER